jgi:hypothetical protein
VKESLGQAQFLRPGKQLGGRFFKPCFTSSTPGFAGWQGAEKSLQGRGRLWSCWPKSVQRLPKADPVSAINGMKLDGLIAAAHTPMNDDFSVNYEQVPAQAGHLAKLGIRGVFVGGTTGECQSLMTGERQKLF